MDDINLHDLGKRSEKMHNRNSTSPVIKSAADYYAASTHAQLQAAQRDAAGAIFILLMYRAGSRCWATISKTTEYSMKECVSCSLGVHVQFLRIPRLPPGEGPGRGLSHCLRTFIYMHFAQS
jgi:hypothetical protein